MSGLPKWLSGKESACQCWGHRFDPCVRRIPWKRKWKPAPGFLSGKSQGQRNLVGYSPWDLKVRMTEQLTLSFSQSLGPARFERHARHGPSCLPWASCKDQFHLFLPPLYCSAIHVFVSLKIHSFLVKTLSWSALEWSVLVFEWLCELLLKTRCPQELFGSIHLSLNKYNTKWLCNLRSFFLGPELW
mgnify:CR=1 FL=1